MTDIVERLRHAVSQRDNNDKEGPGECCYAPYVCIDPRYLLDAADEIERLREALERELEGDLGMSVIGDRLRRALTPASKEE